MGLDFNFGTYLIIAGCALAVFEIFTLTFYIIVIAIGCFAASAVSLHGGSDAMTVATLGMTTIIGMPIAHLLRKKLQNDASIKQTNEDIGNRVTVYSIEADKIRADYRGTQWVAKLINPDLPVKEGDVLYIHSKDGMTLFLSDEKVD